MFRGLRCFVAGGIGLRLVEPGCRRSPRLKLHVQTAVRQGGEVGLVPVLPMRWAMGSVLRARGVGQRCCGGEFREYAVEKPKMSWGFAENPVGRVGGFGVSPQAA